MAFTDAQMQENLIKNGVPAGRAAEIVDIYASINSGVPSEDYEQYKPALGQAKPEDFAKEFAAAFECNGQIENTREGRIDPLP